MALKPDGSICSIREQIVEDPVSDYLTTASHVSQMLSSLSEAGLVYKKQTRKIFIGCSAIEPIHSAPNFCRVAMDKRGRQLRRTYLPMSAGPRQPCVAGSR